MRNGAEPLTKGCFGLMVCLVAEAIRWNSPLQVDPEPSERIQFEVLRSPAVSSAAPNPLAGCGKSLDLEKMDMKTGSTPEFRSHRINGLQTCRSL
jgi:hypothetical protein